ncbi:hypothetical protein CNMCM5793_008329 [Aspergillus hiratsukae]|uniref:Uncharacterized protein n=1 Tax=Aspergillus hiratsukae TaxID=1194566 RepID=A0A8H6UBC7_9EURO|nr:hypothetical protein CNMCM5793_008329 [Aspergillus hiratsukae]KAF7156113.1 hypothetical protein CNMCM6106_008839 [Aspergillus hiratsukae]
MKITTHLSFFLLYVAVASAAPIPYPIINARQEAPPQGEPSPSPLDFESLIANSPVNGVYKVIKEAVKVDLPNMKGKHPA